MNEKDIKTVVLDEDLVREIVSDESDTEDGESRLVRIDPESRKRGEVEPPDKRDGQT